MKQCTKCLELKNLDSFYKKGDGHMAECKACFYNRTRVHIKAKKDNIKVIETCKYCHKEFKYSAIKNHELRCPENKDREYINGMTGKRGQNGYTKAQANNLPKPVYDFKARAKPQLTNEDRERKSQQAKSQGLGGYREKSGRSKKFKVTDSFGCSVLLQSSYELLCSQLLDSLNIRWIRPKSIIYDDNRRYFADFYLVDYAIYLDPKNPYKAKCDQEKIDKVISQNNIKLFVLLLEDITEDHIKQLCS